MKLAKGQRWRCDGPKCVVEIINPITDNLEQEGSALVQIIQRLEQVDSYYTVGSMENFYRFPKASQDSNSSWEYLDGQDKPLEEPNSL